MNLNSLTPNEKLNKLIQTKNASALEEFIREYPGKLALLNHRDAS